MARRATSDQRPAINRWKYGIVTFLELVGSKCISGNSASYYLEFDRMSVKFLDEQEEWIQEYKEKVNSNDEFREVAEDWGVDFNGNYLYAYLDLPGDRGEMVDFIEVEGGEIKHAEHTGMTLDEAQDEYDWGLTVRGPYESWKRLIEGDLDPVDGLMAGNWEVDGDMSRMLQQQRVTEILGKSFREPDTELPA